MSNEILLRAIKALEKELLKGLPKLDAYETPERYFTRVKKSQNTLFTTMLQTKATLDEVIATSGMRFTQDLDIRIDGTNLASRIVRQLHRLQLFTLRDLVTQTEKDLLKIKAFGDTSVQEVRELLTSYGLNLKGEHDQQEETLIEELNLPLRIENALKLALITTLERLLEATEVDLLKTNNLGRSSTAIIKQALAFRGLSLKE